MTPEHHASAATPKALRSLARHAGVPLDEVTAASEAGNLRAVVLKAMSPQRRIARARADLERRRHPNR